MKILAPVNDMDSAMAVITAGAKEIYLGGDDELFTLYSFTGRGKIAYSGKRILSKFNQLKEIISYAHEQGVLVNFLGNIPFFHNGSYQDKAMDTHFLEYIERGVEIGADALVIGDLGLLKLTSDQNYPVDLHASVYFKTINRQQLLFLKEFGVCRTTLSYQVTMEEIQELSKANIMELEVIGYLGCSFFNGGCGFLHDFGEGVKDCFDPGVACKGFYRATNGMAEKTSKIFDCEAGCSICVLGELENLGIEALKIVGRGRNHNQIAEVIELYTKFLNYFRQGISFEEVSDEIPKWWERIWCYKNSCKYKESNLTYSKFIGGNI